MTVAFDFDAASAVMLDVYDRVSPTLREGSIDDISEIVAALDYMKREISEMLDQAKTVMSDQMGNAPEYSTGRFAFEKKMGSTRKAWDHKSLARLVAERMTSLSIDLDTGEVLKSPTELISEAFEFAGVSYWRIKELQKIGVNADAFCEVLDGKPNIIVRTID